jgi:hypothetical protein
MSVRFSRRRVARDWVSAACCCEMFFVPLNVFVGDNQLINHFPNHIELTRKDLMVKNIKRYQRDLHKDSADQERRVPEMVPR